MITKLRFVLLLLIICYKYASAQVPIISYTTPQVYHTGKAITPLTPTNSGGAVAAPAYSSSSATLGLATAYSEGIAVDAAGDVYVADSQNNSIDKIPAGGGSPVIISNQVAYPSGIALDAAGNIYVSEGNNNDIKEIPAGGGVPVIVVSGINQPNALAFDTKGNFYISSNDATTIFEIYAGTTTLVPIGSGFNLPLGVAVDATGNVYVADYGNSEVKEIPVNSSNVIVLGSGFNGPSGVAVDQSGNVIVADIFNNAVTEIPASGGAPISLGGGFNAPQGVGLDANGNLFVLSGTSGNNIAEIKSAGGYFVNPSLPAGLTLNTITGNISGTPTMTRPSTNYTITASNNSGSSSAIINITVTLPNPVISYASPQVYIQGKTITPLEPMSTNVAPAGSSTIVLGNARTATGVAVDANGDVFIAESDQGVVQEIVAGSSTPITFSSSFVLPTGVAVDALGNVYVVDATENTVKKIAAGSGSLTTVANGFYAPYGIAIDAAGNLYVGDASNNEVKEIPSGTHTTVVIGTGFNHPTGVAVDAAGNVYVADRGNNAIKEILKNGKTIVLASGDGNPNGVAVDGAGNVYFADTNETSIVEIPVGGGDEIMVGSGFNKPVAVAVSKQNVVYLSNYIPQQIDAIEPVGGYYISPALPTGLSFSNITGIITGTPTVVSAPTVYTILGYNGNVTGSTSVNISVVSSNANLSNINLNKGALEPVFAAATTKYTDTVTNGTASILLTPTATDANATVTVNGTAVKSGSPSAAIALNVGNNAIAVVVTAQDGVTTKTYTVNVIRPSTNAKLSALTISAGTLSPVFNTNTTSYTASVTTPSITLTPTVAVPGATIKVNGVTVTSGSPSAAIALSVGSNTITTVVTAQDGITVDTYTLTVTRTLSTNASLSNITLSKGTLSPAFATTTTTYTDMVTNGTASVTLTPTLADANAAVSVNGTAVKSGSPSGAIALSVGNNTVTIIVTAEDGTTKNTYNVNVIRPSTNAKLSALTISAGTLTPAFNANTTSYTASVTNVSSPITLTPTAAISGATIKVNGTAVTSGSPSGPIALSVGTNTITTVVTAQDGVTIDTYTITVTRAASNDAGLSNITLNKGTLSPAFAMATTSYTDMVTNGTTSITLTPTLADATATVTVNGTAVSSGKASGAIALAVGNNTLTTVVTAQDGTTKNTYTVTVIRPSTNAKLSALTLSNGPLTPVFNTNTTSYTASVTNTTTSVTITPTVVVNGATIKVNGTAVASGSASAAIALSVGSDTITTVVTAQDGTTTDTYTINVTRPAAANIPDAEISVQTPTDKPLFDEDMLVVHQGISPNGDGVNDFLVIDGISACPDNKLSIMNRNGQLVFEAKGYDNSTKTFDGHSNKTGQMQLPGTYFYSLDYTVKGVLKHKTGFLVLKY